MKGLILRDICFLKENWKLYLGLLIFEVVFTVKTQSQFYMIFMNLFLGISLVLSILALEEGGGYAYSLCIPIRRSDIVKSTYVAVLGFLVLLVAMAGVFDAVLYLFGLLAFTLEDVGIIVVMFCFCLWIPIVLIPVSIKWNTSRARFIVVIIFLAFACGAFWLEDAGILTETTLGSIAAVRLQWIVLAALLLTAMEIWISYRISVSVFEKMDF